MLGGLRLSFLFGALELIPMGLVHTILNGSPVIVMVLSHFILKDPCNMLKTVSTLGLLAGVVLIFQPHKLILESSGQVSKSRGQSNQSN
jgi:drug/metabolite transporter (DMT)-like permease